MCILFIYTVLQDKKMRTKNSYSLKDSGIEVLYYYSVNVNMLYLTTSSFIRSYMGPKSKLKMKRGLCVVLLILLFVLGYLLIKYSISETWKTAEGKSLHEDVRGNAPKCWLPERKILFSVACPVLTDEVRTELAIMLSSCLCEAKGLPSVVCEKTKLSFCHQNRNCLYECGMLYGIKVSEPRLGYNVFERMFEGIPFMCKYILDGNEVHLPIEPFDWDLFKEILLTNQHNLHEDYSRILARPHEYSLPHLRNLEQLIFHRLTLKDTGYYFRNFQDYVRAWIASPSFGYTLLVGIIVFVILTWLFDSYFC